MIYLVTKQQQLFKSDLYSLMTVEESLKEIESWNLIQLDSETNGRDPHLCYFLCVSMGNDKADKRIVIDCTTIDIREYKELLESKFCILQNAKFDLQFFYNYGIIIRRVYDTMIVEQFLYLGWPHVKMRIEQYEHDGYKYPYHDTNNGFRELSFALDAIAKARLGKNIDKSIRGEIIWRGLDSSVIKYAAGDVTHLEEIMRSQLKDVYKIPNAIKGIEIECNFIPVIAYLEWCGIKLDEKKWLAKMQRDKERLRESLETLNNYAVNHPKLKKWAKIDTQGDLWEGFCLTPKWTVDWQKKEVINVVKALGFDTKTVSKVTEKESDSVMEKVLSNQKGIDDEFLKLYFDYQGKYKVITSFGQGHLNAINPKTGRIHTVYRAIGTSTGRMSSGSQQPNTDLAKYKHIPEKECTYPNMQQLPKGEETRSCFVAEKGNLFCSCDWSAMEARIGAEVYNEKMLLDEFLYRSGDTHAAYAKVVFADALKDVDIKDIKKKRPDLRDKVKSVEFAVN